MLFLNLDKLKIQKSYNYESRGFSIDESVLNMNIQEIQAEVKSKMTEYVKDFKPSIECCYELFLGNNKEDAGQKASDEEIEAFQTFVNIAISEFLTALCLDHGRKREHRLGIPAALVPVKASAGILKKAINTATICDVFNFKIYYKDLVYMLIDEKEDTFNA